MSYAEAQKFKYLLDNDIPPSDWRTDLVSSYWDQYKRVELEALEQLKNPLLAEEERAELELSVADARAKMAEIDALLALYNLQQEYAAGNLDGCRILLQEISDEGLEPLLPTSAQEGIPSPAQQYQELREAILNS